LGRDDSTPRALHPLRFVQVGHVPNAVTPGAQSCCGAASGEGALGARRPTS
jgi:hypothetical protein